MKWLYYARSVFVHLCLCQHPLKNCFRLGIHSSILGRVIIFFIGMLLYSSGASAYIYDHETSIRKYLDPVEISEFDSGLELIDCIYVINLDERPVRWKQIKALCDKNGIKPNRFRAINGWNLSKEAKQELAGPYPDRLDGGKIGCLLSHVSIFQDAYQRGFNIIWILEDDEEFLGDIRQIPNSLKNLIEIDPDWDNFFTDVNSRNQMGEYVRALAIDPRPDQKLHSLPYYIHRIKKSDDIIQIRERYGTYSIIWSKNGIKRALDYFTHVYLWTCVDIDIHYIPGIREYSATRDIVTNLLNHAESDTLPASTLNPENQSNIPK